MKKKFILAVSVILVIVMTSLLFVACMSDNDTTDENLQLDMDKLVSRLEKEGYALDVIDEPHEVGPEEDTLYASAAIYAELEDGRFIYVAWFDNSKSADDFYNILKNEPEVAIYCKIVKKGNVVAYGKASVMEILEDKSLYTVKESNSTDNDNNSINSGSSTDDDNNNDSSNSGNSSDEEDTLDIFTVKTKLENNGYSVAIFSGSIDSDEYGENVLEIISAVKGLSATINIIWYKDVDSAEKLFNEILESPESVQSMINSKYKIAILSNAIISGTESAVRFLLGEQATLYPEYSDNDLPDIEESPDDNDDDTYLPEDVWETIEVFKQNDYQIMIIPGDEAVIEFKVECSVLVIVDNLEGDNAIIVWCEDSADLEKYYNQLVEEAEDRGLNVDDLDFIKTDNTIIYGTENAMDLIS